MVVKLLFKFRVLLLNTIQNIAHRRAAIGFHLPRNATDASVNDPNQSRQQQAEYAEYGE